MPANWTFLSNHAHVLLCLAMDPEQRMREVADLVGITEGLSAGDRVVVVGGQKLSAGAKVTEAPAAK